MRYEIHYRGRLFHATRDRESHERIKASLEANGHEYTVTIH